MGVETNGNIEQSLENYGKQELDFNKLKKNRPGLFLDRLNNGDYEISFVFGGIKSLNDTIGKGTVDFVLKKVKKELENKYDIKDEDDNEESQSARKLVDDYRVFSLTIPGQGINEEKLKQIENDFKSNGLNLIKNKLLENLFEEEIKQKIIEGKLEAELDKLIAKGEIIIKENEEYLNEYIEKGKITIENKKEYIKLLINSNDLKSIQLKNETKNTIKNIINETNKKEYSQDIFDTLSMEFDSTKIKYNKNISEPEKLKEKFFSHYKTISGANIKSLLHSLDGEEKTELEKQLYGVEENEKLTEKVKHIEKLKIISIKTIEIKQDILKDIGSDNELFYFLLGKIRKGKGIDEYLNQTNKNKKIAKNLNKYKEYISVFDVIMPLIKKDCDFNKLNKKHKKQNKVIRKIEENEILDEDEQKIYKQLGNENYKGTFNREGLNKKILENFESGKKGSLMFVDIAGMGILNIKENEKIAKKLVNGQITEKNSDELLKAGLETTTVFLKITEKIKKLGCSLSLGGDEIFIYKEDGEVTKKDREKVTELLKKEDLDARATYVSLKNIKKEEKNSTFINKLFEKLDFLSYINKIKEEHYDEIKQNKRKDILDFTTKEYYEKIQRGSNLTFYKTNLENLEKTVIPEDEEKMKKLQGETKKIVFSTLNGNLVIINSEIV